MEIGSVQRQELVNGEPTGNCDEESIIHRAPRKSGVFRPVDGCFAVSGSQWDNTNQSHQIGVNEPLSESRGEV